VRAPVGSEREREGRRVGACGPARGKEKWAGPEEAVEFLIYSNNFQTSLNCFDQKVEFPSSKKIQIKYAFEGKKIINKSHRNPSKFGLEFKLKFKEALGFEFQ
jgi:hypothetical protein